MRVPPPPPPTLPDSSLAILQGQTTGFVAFGLTTGTGMVGGQVVIGWVANGVATVGGYSLREQVFFSTLQVTKVCSMNLSSLHV